MTEDDRKPQSAITSALSPRPSHPEAQPGNKGWVPGKGGWKAGSWGSFPDRSFSPQM